MRYTIRWIDTGQSISYFPCPESCKRMDLVHLRRSERRARPFLCDSRTHSFSSPSPAGSSINVQKRATKVLERLRRYFIQETLTATRFRHYIIPPRRLLAYDCVVAVGPLHFSIVIKKMATATHDVWGNKREENADVSRSAAASQPASGRLSRHLTFPYD